MNWILKIILAILIGVLTMYLLDYFHVLTHNINALIGVVVALLFYFGAPEITGRA